MEQFIYSHCKWNSSFVKWDSEDTAFSSFLILNELSPENKVKSVQWASVYMLIFFKGLYYSKRQNFLKYTSIYQEHSANRLMHS